MNEKTDQKMLGTRVDGRPYLLENEILIKIRAGLTQGRSPGGAVSHVYRTCACPQLFQQPP